MRTFLLMMVVLPALTPCPQISGDDEQQIEAGGTVGTEPDANAAGQVPMNAGQLQSDLTSYAQAVGAMTQQVEAQPAGDDLYHNLITYNAAQMQTLLQARQANNAVAPQGPSIALGTSALALGGEVTDIDYRNAYPAAPQQFSFIVSERNRLAGLNNQMKRSQAWLNKHTCGGFDWATQFNFLFRLEILKEYLQQLGEGVIAAAPMALLGAFSPQLAEIVKHLKLMAGMNLSASKADCQAIQNALTSGAGAIKSMWADSYMPCLDQNKDNGLDAAVAICQSATSTSITASDGTQTNPQTSQAAAASAGSWLSNSYSQTTDWFSNLFPGNSSAAAASTIASTAAAAAGNGGASANEQQGMLGLADSTQDPSVGNLLGNDLGNAVSDLASTLFGSVRIQGTGALEVGRKSYTLFDLKVQAHAARLHDSLVLQLLDHYDIITANPCDNQALAASYQKLKLWTFQSRGADFGIQPWLNSDIAPRDASFPAATLNQRIDDHTMDACAFLLQLNSLYRFNDAVLYPINQKYGIQEFVSALAQFECFLYIYHNLYDKYQRLVELTNQQPASGTDNGTIRDAARQQFTSALNDLRNGLLEKQAMVLSHLDAINSFRPWAVASSVQLPASSATPLPQPQVRFPR